MKNFQFLFLVLVIVLSSCQGDSSPASSVKVEDKSKITSVAKKAKEIQMTENEVSETVSETETVKEDKPKIIEFYVKEDKKKETPKASATEKSSASTATKSAASKKKKSRSKGGAKMKFTDDTFAFGTIKPGDVIEHKFEFTNTGTTDLVVTDAKATCGCTQPSFPFIPIPPGEKGFIGVKYDSTGKLGVQKPTVTLTTNASPRTQKVYLEGLVISKMSN